MINLDKTFNLLESAMDVRASRHKAIAENIANMDTPGYKSKDIDFAQVLRAKVGEGVSMAATNTKHIQAGADGSASLEAHGLQSDREHGLDGNTVNAEGEMVKLAENTLMYNASAQILSSNFRTLRSAIQGGR
ncbi:MAG TPA: flagellar basal body rod protein FlgB [Nitrospirota bacterium]|jgi:flagellar basal-body rod protein FlgB